MVGIGRPALLSVGLFAAFALLAPTAFRGLRADSLPQVKLNADAIAPRSIEELTGHNVARDYAYAWRDLARALDSNRSDLLNDYFTGFAKENFTQRIADQKHIGITVRYVDHGHTVKAFFYAPDGGEMQLIDKAELEMQIMDGGKVIHQETLTQPYLVLMTPGADRWFVRSLDPIANK
jgi:hypothetical protein